MDVPEITKDHVIALLEQMDVEQRSEVLNYFATAKNELQPPKPKKGSAKKTILYMSDDFDASLNDFSDYI